MVTDIHCHVIPGVDDGARDLRESLRMLEKEAAEGIRAVVATPHFNEQTSIAALERYRNSWDRLQELLYKRRLPVLLYPGNEIFYTENVLKSLERACHGNE